MSKCVFEAMIHHSQIAALLLVLALAAGARADSLWTAAGGDHPSMFADHKASRTGDIVTVVVQEAAAASSTQNKESTRTSTVNDAVTQFLFTNALSHAGQAPSIQLAGKSDYTGVREEKLRPRVVDRGGPGRFLVLCARGGGGFLDDHRHDIAGPRGLVVCERARID